MSTVTRWLVFAEVGVIFTGLEPPRSRSMVAVRLVADDEPIGTTVWLTYDDVVADRLLEWDHSGALVRDERLPAPTAVSTALPFDRRSGELLRPQRRVPGLTGGRLVPVLLVSEAPGDGGPEAAVHCCSRVRQSGLLFSRIWAGGVPPDQPVPVTVQEACRREPALLTRFADEGYQSTRFDADIEIELKLTLLDETAPWEIANNLAEAVQRREIPGFIPDLGNEMQRWTYEQDTFEVVSAEHQGYVAFMTAHNGAYEVKYKYFAEDALRRYERCVEGVVIEPSQFVDHIRATVPGAEIRPLPHLRRTRFDVNVESARAGHYFGLEMDEVWAGGRVLRQLEIEYHKSRACYGVTVETVEPELFRLSEEVEALLLKWGVKAERGYLSKLSFLKDVAGSIHNGATPGD